eukprot:scaffold1509_cov240-Pinguiococcus_pyrenoidosus.AAC.52
MVSVKLMLSSLTSCSLKVTYKESFRCAHITGGRRVADMLDLGGRVVQRAEQRTERGAEATNAGSRRRRTRRRRAAHSDSTAEDPARPAVTGCSRREFVNQD